MNKILKNFSRYLDNLDLPYSFSPNNDNLLVIEQSLSKNPSAKFTIGIICDNDTNDVLLLASGFGIVNNITIDVSRLINELNQDCMYYKFYIDTDTGQITMGAAAKIENIAGNKIIFDMVVGALEIADEVYPKFMRMLWG